MLGEQGREGAGGEGLLEVGLQGQGAGVFPVSAGPFAVVRGPWLQCADHRTARPHHQSGPGLSRLAPAPVEAACSLFFR